MSPHALRQRMRHGNVYPPERTQVALDRFFTEANLTALRELSLRLVARKVEGQIEGVLVGERMPLVTDRVVVHVDGSEASQRAIRRACTLAGALHGALVAVVVETPDLERSSFDRGRDLKEAIDDAVDLGAEVVRVAAPDVVTGLEQAVRERGATHLVLGHQRARGLRRFTERPLADRLIERHARARGPPRRLSLPRDDHRPVELSGRHRSWTAASASHPDAVDATRARTNRTNSSAPACRQRSMRSIEGPSTRSLTHAAPRRFDPTVPVSRSLHIRQKCSTMKPWKKRLA